MTVFIVEDSEAVRARLVELLSSISGLEVVGQAADAAKAIQDIKQQRPDFVLLDLRLAEGSGLEVLERIKAGATSPMVMVLTGYPDPHYRKRCQELGAEFFFEKNGDWDQILEVFRGVTRIDKKLRHQRDEAARQVAVQQVREAVWQMASTDEVSQVLAALRAGLEQLRVPFLDCEIHLLVPYQPYAFRTSSIHRDGTWSVAESIPQGQSLLRRTWEQGQPVYRQDLEGEDIYQEKTYIETAFGHQIRSVVDIPFDHGVLAVNSPLPDAFSSTHLADLRALAQALDEGFRRLEDLQAIKEERRRTEERLKLALTLQRVRNQGLQMQTEEDWEKVAMLLRRELQASIPIKDCGIELIDRSRGTFETYVVGPEGLSMRGRGDDLPASLQLAMDTGGPVYRRNQADILRLDDNRYIVESGIRSILDVPFSGGTVAINSTAEEAFSEQDIQLLEQFAQVLSEVYHRLQDLQALEAERRRAEERLKLDLALQRVRNEILQMRTEEDWEKVVRTSDRELRRMVEYNECGINVIDLQKGRVVPYSVRGRHPEEKVTGEKGAIIARIRETGKPLYRPRRTAPLFSPSMPPEINSVVDVPFSGGAVAFNSTAEDAFSEGDLQIFELFAQVISEAYRRLEDLKALNHKEAQLRQAQKMESVGRLAGGVAHDFNNLLTIINGTTQLLQKSLDPGDPRREDAEEVRQAGERAATLVRQLLTYSRQQVLEPRLLDLNRVIADLGKMLRRVIGEDVELVLALAPQECLVFADPGQLEQVLMNLVVNARDAMPGGGGLKIETALIELDEQYLAVHEVEGRPGPYVQLAVSDTGAGMDQDTQTHLFEPFFTTKEPGKGTGLGLATVYGIVKQSSGYIWVHSELGQGTTFRICLPQVEREGEAQTGEEAGTTAALRGRETVLVVEDDEGVCRLAAQLLRDQGYTVLAARNGTEALFILGQQGSEISLVLTDVVMPRMSGIDLAAKVAQWYPGIEIIYMSGYAEHAALPQDLQEIDRNLLQKPFADDALVRQVRQTLDRARASRDAMAASAGPRPESLPDRQRQACTAGVEGVDRRQDD